MVVWRGLLCRRPHRLVRRRVSLSAPWAPRRNILRAASPLAKRNPHDPRLLVIVCGKAKSGPQHGLQHLSQRLASGGLEELSVGIYALHFLLLIKALDLVYRLLRLWTNARGAVVSLLPSARC